jgi:hypothetical protein
VTKLLRDRWSGGVPWGLVVLVLGAVVAMATVMALAGRPANSPAPARHPAPTVATPSPLWHPPANWKGTGTIPDPGVRPVVGL